MPGVTTNIPNNSDLGKKIRQEVRWRVKASVRRIGDYEKVWKQAEETTLAYLPEREVDAIRRGRRENGLPEYTTIQIPYSYAVLMSAHTYLASVFMGRDPTFQFSGRHGEPAQQVQAVEALIDYQTQVGAQLGPLYIWLYDALKYGVAVLGTYWEERTENISQISMQPKIDPLLGTPLMDAKGEPVLEKVKSTKRVPTYKGNILYNLQPWDFIFDVNYPIREFQRGEYCGVRRVLSWNECKRREARGFYMNLDQVSKDSGSRNEVATTFGSDELNRPETYENWASDGQYSGDGVTSNRPQQVPIYEMYIEIIPKEWGLGGSDFPEKWVFTVTDDFTVLVGAQPLGAFHAKYPFNVLTVEPEGYGLIPRGMVQTLQPVQQTIDWLVNSHFYNVRAALNNKYVVDPSRVVMKDVLDPLPGGVIRMKAEAFGSDTRTAMTQMQVTDVTQNHLRDLQLMFGMGERTVGVNDQIMGMLNTGGRRTATEIRTSTSFGVNRLKTIAEFFSATGFSPLAQMNLQNTQQYYSGEMKFRIAGDLASAAGPGFINVTPEQIMGFYDFIPVDGALPIDKYAMVNMWKELMMQVRQMPEIALRYDFGRMFEWIAQLAGMKNITQFRAQIVPDEQMILQAKLGNVVPVTGRQGRAPGGQPNGMVPGQPAQVPGMGPA